MRSTIYTLFCGLFFISALNAQIGCPGCATKLPTLATDTVYIGKLPDGEAGKAYNQDVSFRMPKSTTPVAAIDGVTPPGLPISKIEILGVEGLPEGLKWQPNKTTFDTGAGETDGCVKICGIPTETDSFVLKVRIKASIFIIQQETSFPMRLYIAPKKKITDGFTMTGYEGCDELLVNFTNNVPSNGQPGYSYQWNFGDSTTFSGENPPPHPYRKPGKYPVRYRALVDTVGPVLESITLLNVDCTDLFNGPDIYCIIKNPAGTKVFDSSPAATNAVFPLKIAVNLPVGLGNYTIIVADDDAGIKGSDDDCGSMPFNTLSGDTLTAGGLKLILKIRRPIDTVISMDTVTVFPPAEKPTIIDPMGLNACIGVDSVTLTASYPTGITWWSRGKAIPGAVTNRYRPLSSGYYRALHTNAFGCATFSDSVKVGINPVPLNPVYQNDKNILKIQNPPGLPPAFVYQWFLGNNPIAGATGTSYCARQSGNIGVTVKNTATGCSSFYATSVQLDPNGVNCTIGTDDLAIQSLLIFPNPATEVIQVRWNVPTSGEGQARLWDVAGRLLSTHTVYSGTDLMTIPLYGLSAGIYLVEIQTSDFRGMGRVVIRND